MFKIDKVGFYKNGKGEKVEIIRDWLWLDTKGRHYYDNGDRATLDETIVAKWTEQDELAHETDCVSRAIWAVNDNDGEWREVASYEEAVKIAKDWLKDTPQVIVDIWKKAATYTAEVEIKEIKI